MLRNVEPLVEELIASMRSMVAFLLGLPHETAWPEFSGPLQVTVPPRDFMRLAERSTLAITNALNAAAGGDHRMATVLGDIAPGYRSLLEANPELWARLCEEYTNGSGQLIDAPAITITVPLDVIAIDRACARFETDAKDRYFAAM